MARLQAKVVFAARLDRAAVDVGADPEVDADGAGVEVHAFFAVVHVLEVLLEQGDVDDLAGDEGGVVEGGGEGFGVGVGTGTWRVDGLLERRKGYIYTALGVPGGGGQGWDEPPAVPSATWVVPAQPNEVVSELPSGKP